MKKFIMTIFLVAFMGTLMCGTALAAEEEKEITIKLNPNECILIDANGNEIAVPYGTLELGSATLDNNILAMWNNNGKYFNMKDGTKVRFIIYLSTEETHVEMGYLESDGTRHSQNFTRNGKTYSSTFYIDGDGLYGFYFLNTSAGQIKIKDGSLTF